MMKLVPLLLRGTAFVAAMAGYSLQGTMLFAQAITTDAVDFASLCGLTTGGEGIVDLTFADGSRTLADGDIATALVALNRAHYNNPPASVEITAPGIKCSQERFEFDANNTDTFTQQALCRTAGGSSSVDGAIVDLAMMFKYAPMIDPLVVLAAQSLTTICEKIMYERQVIESSNGGGFGDPHLVTLDGVAYDFQIPGVFRFFESRNLQVQVFQEKCTPVAHRGARAPSCYQGVAVAFAGSVVRFFIHEGVIAVARGSESMEWLSVEKSAQRSDGYRVFMVADRATYVDVFLSTWIRNYPYLNVALRVSPYFKDITVHGLMGNWNGDKEDDVTNNKQLAALHEFSLEDNLFTCMAAECLPFLQPESKRDRQAITLATDTSFVSQGFTPLTASAIALQSFEPVLQPLPALRRGLETQDMSPKMTADTPEAFHELVRELCTETITQIPACHKYVANRTFFIESVCVADTLMLEDLSVVDNTKLAYLRDCRRELDGRIEANTSTVADAQVLLDDRTALSFGDIATCANDCSGRGTCLAPGCECYAGYTGFTCQIETEA